MKREINHLIEQNRSNDRATKMSSSVHPHPHLHHHHSLGGPSNLNLDFLNSALVSILSKKYQELSLDDDAIMYIKYLIMKIIKILLSGHPIGPGHVSTSPLTSASGTTISNSIGSTNGPTAGPLSSRSSSGSSSVVIRLADLEERINATFPCELDEAILQSAGRILSDLNSSYSESTLTREGSLNENISGTLKTSILNQAGISKLSGKNRKPPSKQDKMKKISKLTDDHVIDIPFLSFSRFIRELIGGGKETKFDPEPDVIVFMMVVIEHIITEILESSGKFVSNIPEKSRRKKCNISKEDIKISMYAGTVIKSLFKPDDEVNYDHEEAVLCLQSNPGPNHQPSSLCFFSLDLDPKFIGKLIENKENEKLLRQQRFLDQPSSSDSSIAMNHEMMIYDNQMNSSNGAPASRVSQRSSQMFLSNQNVTYEDVVKELITEEKFFIRDLQLIIKLFRESFFELMKQQETDSSSLPSSPTSPTTPSLTSSSLMSTLALLNDQQSSVPSSPIHKSFGTRIKASDIDAIFSNITDIEELSVKLLCSLEDTLEAMISSNLANDDVVKSGSGNNLSGSNPGSVTSMSKSVIESIGSVFQDFAEDQEFDVYEIFASDIIGNHALQQHQHNNNNNYGAKNNLNQFLSGYNWSTSPSNQVLQELLADNTISKPLATAGKGFLQQIKYILPKLLMGIIYHCYTYFNYISILKSLSPSEEDRESFSVVEGLLKPLELKLGMMTGIVFRSGVKVPVLFGQHFFTLHHPGLASSSTSPSSANTGTMTLNPANGAPSVFSSVTSYGPLITHTLTSTTVNANPKIIDLICKIDGIDLSLHQYMNCLVLDGSLYKSSATSKSHPKTSERKVFLFDGILLLCKDVLPSKKSTKVSTAGCLIHYGQTKRYLISDIEVIDLPDPPVVHSSASFSTGSSARDSCCNNSIINPSLPGQPLNEDHLTELSSSSSMSLRSPWGTSTTSLVSTSSNTLIQGSGIGSSLSIKSDYIPRVKNAFGIIVRESKEFIVLSADSVEVKNLWISSLIFLTSRNSLEKNLETILNEEDRKNPLQVPPPEKYRFTLPDSYSNIVFEDNKFNNAGAPLIKAATMAKLIERLTYHLYADPTFVRVFLTTYRSFSNPRELLEFLKERFDVPDIESKAREDVKKFEKDYVKPVQLRVLNVIRHWVDQHYYDFTNDEELLDDLIVFLDKTAGKQKALKKWVDSILKNIYRNRENNHAADMSIFFNSSPPHFEWHIISAENVSSAPREMFNLLTIHPIEFARQFTLLEYELFKKVKPAELVDSAWTKKDREEISPNLLRFKRFGNHFTFWLELQILETENFEERVAVYSRILEILQVFQELNNFDGIIAIVAALTSAPIHRLDSTKEAISNRLKKSFEEAGKLVEDHYKPYFAMLRSINPPCVPFIGQYLTHIIQFDVGNPNDFKKPTSPEVRDDGRPLGSSGDSVVIETSAEQAKVKKLINFTHRRKVAEITQEIQQYQNTPYCLNQQPQIRSFLESINPFECQRFVEFAQRKAQEAKREITDVSMMSKGDLDWYFGDYAHELSVELEPKKRDGIRMPVKKAARRWPELSLKSPGIKPSPAPSNPAGSSSSGASNTVLLNTLSRARGVFASAVATSGLSLSNKKNQNMPINNLGDPSYTAQISPNAVTLSFREKDHYPITLPSNQGSSHHHHVRQSSLTQPHQGSFHGGHHYPVAPLTPLPFSSSLSSSYSDHSVFAPVIIGGGGGGYGGTGYPPLTPVPSTPLSPDNRGQFNFYNSGGNHPPALPPRRQRLASTTSQSYDESMSSHCSGGSDNTLQPPARTSHPITPLIPSTPSTPGSSSMGQSSGHSQNRNIFNFPPPLPPPESTPPILPPRPERITRMISSLSVDQSLLGATSASSDPPVSQLDTSPPPPLPPRGVQQPLVHRNSFHRGSRSQLSSPSSSMRPPAT